MLSVQMPDPAPYPPLTDTAGWHKLINAMNEGLLSMPAFDRSSDGTTVSELTIGGVPGVLLAAFIFSELPVNVVMEVISVLNSFLADLVIVSSLGAPDRH